MVTVYTKNNCQPCKMTKREMDKLGVSYTEISLDADPDLAMELAEKGYMAAPVVITEEDSWAGFIPAKIKELA